MPGRARADRLSNRAEKKIRRRSQFSMTHVAAKPSPTSAAPTPVAISTLRRPPARKRAARPAAREAAAPASAATRRTPADADAVRCALDRRSSTPRHELSDVRTTLATSPSATPPTAREATAAAPVMTVADSRGKRRVSSRAPSTMPVRLRAAAPTTGSRADPTVTPRLRVLCVSFAREVAVVFMRLAYSCSTEPATSPLAILKALRRVSICVISGVMAATDSSPNRRLMMELRSSGRTFCRDSSTRMTAPLASVCNSFCSLLGSIRRYL